MKTTVLLTAILCIPTLLVLCSFIESNDTHTSDTLSLELYKDDKSLIEGSSNPHKSYPSPGDTPRPYNALRYLRLKRTRRWSEKRARERKERRERRKRRRRRLRLRKLRQARLPYVSLGSITFLSDMASACVVPFRWTAGKYTLVKSKTSNLSIELETSCYSKKCSVVSPSKLILTSGVNSSDVVFGRNATSVQIGEHQDFEMMVLGSRHNQIFLFHDDLTLVITSAVVKRTIWYALELSVHSKEEYSGVIDTLGERAKSRQASKRNKKRFTKIKSKCNSIQVDDYYILRKKKARKYQA